MVPTGEGRALCSRLPHPTPRSHCQTCWALLGAAQGQGRQGAYRSPTARRCQPGATRVSELLSMETKSESLLIDVSVCHCKHEYRSLRAGIVSCLLTVLTVVPPFC
ncbi:hypothetical protein UY3_04177 [Chelonia mydas]|uniref:Uncharacterized protein n=1 Tax=Chelonia mydas TaxID=8469 RepID=M7BL31_CHEMY|nr:hypothetical protein UY3_04177 [Chelonia mydas]